MALADLMKSFKTPQERGIFNDLDQYILSKKSTKDLGRPYEDRAVGVHHPSALSSIDCIRRHVYSWLDTKITNSQKNVVSDAIFGAGHDFGYRMQAYFWDMGILLGEWMCIECKHTWLDMQNPSPRKCPKCGAKLEILFNLHYLEVPVFNTKRNILGRSDGALLRDWGIQLLELKTIKNRDTKTRDGVICFDDLIAPKLEHQYQLNLYMGMAHDLYGSCDTGIALYGAKNTNRRKEFTLNLIPERLNEMYLRAELVDKALEMGILPDRCCSEKRECYSKFCPWYDFCWTEHTFADADRRVKNDGKDN